MKILVYGAGVLGSLYAARLKSAGHAVSILARGERAAELRTHGILLHAINKEKYTLIPIDVVESLEPEDAYDLVIVLVRSSQTASVLPALAANRNTPNVLFLGNNAGGPEKALEMLGRERVLVGFAGAGGIRDDHAVCYIEAKRGDQGATVIGELNGDITQRLERIQWAFRNTGLPVVFSRDIDAWLKTHAAVVLPIACAIYAAGGDNYRLANTPDAVVLMVRAMREGFNALRKLGVPITPTKLSMMERLPEPLLVFRLRRMLDTQFAEIGLAGHANAARDEMAYLMEQFQVLVQTSGVATPALDLLKGWINVEFLSLPENSRQVRLRWRSTVISLGILAWLIALIVFLTRRFSRKTA
jgi:2-dehydropantoate 2-reductase